MSSQTPWFEAVPTATFAPAASNGPLLQAVTRAFLAQPKSAREGFLSNLSDEDLGIVFEEWVQRDDFRLMDVFDPDLSENTYFKLERYVNGSEKWNIPSPRKHFYIAPNPDWSPHEELPDGWLPRVEVAMRRGQRGYLIIDRPMSLDSQQAIKALSHHGPTGKFNHTRGALIEVDRDVYLAYESEQRAKREADEIEVNAAQALASQDKANKNNRRSK